MAGEGARGGAWAADAGVADEGGYSYYNDSEARAVMRVVQQLLGAGMAVGDIGVITPYNGQVGGHNTRRRAGGRAGGQGGGGGMGQQGPHLRLASTCLPA
jgi:hypothetical protein